MELVKKHWVAEEWGIEEAPGNWEFPFSVVCYPSNSDKIIFACKNVDEAHGKLRAIADEYARQGHLVGIR